MVQTPPTMTINCKGKLVDLSQAKIMGILNVTPDSFYDGGKFKDPEKALHQVETMLKQGADFIDIGAYSSKPGANEVSEKEELERITPIVTLITKKFPEALLSIDTFRSKVAAACIDLGAAMINDITAGTYDPNMLDTVAKLRVPYIMMHMRGTPKTMQNLTNYDNLLEEILFFFSERLALTKAKGIVDVILDPGFGFAKTVEQNYHLLQQLNSLAVAERPILAGLSRKSMIYKVLGTSVNEALNGSTALHMVALTKGAGILRVHDVKEASECVALFKQLNA